MDIGYKKLDACSDWTESDLYYATDQCERIATEKFNLSLYPNRIEVINSEQMLDAYCITPDHKVLRTDLKWIEAGSIKVGDKILGFDEEGPFRKYRESIVTQADRDLAEVYSVVLSSGKEFKVTKEHLWLVRQQKGEESVLQWRSTDQLRGLNHHTGYSPSRIPKVMNTWETDETREGGWLAGIFDGEGYILRDTLQKLNVSQNKGPILESIGEALIRRGITFSVGHVAQTEKCKCVSILGTVEQKLQFLGEISPKRLINDLSFERLGVMKTPNYEEVISVTPIGVKTIVKIATSTKTFVCDGYPMHNSAIGMPIFYKHWSFGKQFVKEQQAYKRGLMGLAYEIVINSNPCISYLMEENTLCLQTLVIAHAAMGHNSVFKNNFLFKQWTDAEGILAYLNFANNYINDCEERYGYKEVEELLDACHALRYQGVDRYKRPISLSKKEKEKRNKEREIYLQTTYDDIWRTIPVNSNLSQEEKAKKDKFPKEPQENLLYFLEKHTPNLPDWKREIIRIVRKINQYFYPQMQTKVLNEGRATQIHYWIMNELYNEGRVTDGFMLEFQHNHTNVILQRNYNQPGGQSFNPYALGFAIFEDIKRICLDPTEEDKEWFPDWAGCGDYLKITQHAADDYKDDSFIQQFLSPKLIRDFRMFWFMDDEAEPKYHIRAIHDKEGYKLIRDRLAANYNISNIIPDIQVTNVDLWGDRSLELTYYSKNRRQLEEKDAEKTLFHLQKIWGYNTHIRCVNEEGTEFATFSHAKD